VVALDTIVLVGLASTLCVGLVILIVGVLTLRSARKTGELAENLTEHQIEAQERLELIRSLRQELDRERQERQRVEEELTQEREEHLRAQQRAERAEQEALQEATRQLRARMDAYLKELSEADTWPGGGGGIRRVK
jgi:biopolymer transport protein ExbB/TolQ